MPTGIYIANATIGTGMQSVVLERIAVKKLPVHVLLADSHFVKSLFLKVGEKKWKQLLRQSSDSYPAIKIEYLQPLGITASEPHISYIAE